MAPQAGTVSEEEGIRSSSSRFHPVVQTQSNIYFFIVGDERAGRLHLKLYVNGWGSLALWTSVFGIGALNKLI